MFILIQLMRSAQYSTMLFFRVFYCPIIFLLAGQLGAQSFQEGDYTELSTFLPSLGPSPTAAAFAKYVDFPVNLATGVPAVSVPIGELAGDGIGVGVTLSYHAGGVRVDELAADVGLGWSLDVGGIVSRTVRGVADDHHNGWLNVNDRIPAPTNNAQNLYIFDELARGLTDGEPDLFTFSAGGYSGKFVFNENDEVRIDRHTDVRIDYQTCSSCPYGLGGGSIISFTITVPTGQQYTFGTPAGLEYSKTYSDNLSGVTCIGKTYDKPAPTAWRLVRMTNPLTQDTIRFTYAPNQITYEAGFSETIRYQPPRPGKQNACGPSFSWSKCITTKVDYGVILQRIESSRGILEFKTDSDRQDLADLQGDTRIKAVVKRGKLGEQLGRIELVYTTVTSKGSSVSKRGNHAKNRLYLDGVIYFGSDDLSIQQCAFEYAGRGGLPPRLSLSQDHWGYYNGAQNNTLISSQEEAQIQNHYSRFRSANRATSPTHAAMGVLTTITYPTGGTERFTFESNTISVCKNVDREVEEIKYNPSNIYNGKCPGINEQVQTDTVTIKKAGYYDINYSYLRAGEGIRYNTYLEVRKEGEIDPIWKSGGTKPSGGPNVSEQDSKQVYFEVGVYRMTTKVYQYTTEVGESCARPEYAYLSVTRTKTVTDYIDGESVGGLRIASITKDDGDDDHTDDLVRRYLYQADYAPGCGPRSSTGVLVGRKPSYDMVESSLRDYVYTMGDGGVPSYRAIECQVSIASSSSVYSVFGSAGSVVAYSNVCELLGGDEAGGRICRTFRVRPDAAGRERHAYNRPTDLFAPLSNTSLFNGTLLGERQYNAMGDTVSKTVSTYSFTNPIGRKTVWGIKVRNTNYGVRGHIYGVKTYSCSDDGIKEDEDFSIYSRSFESDLPPLPGTFVESYTYRLPCYNRGSETKLGPDPSHITLEDLEVEWYEFYSRRALLLSSTSTLYDENGNTNTSTTHYEYDLDGYHTLPTATRTTNSDGSVHEVRHTFSGTAGAKAPANSPLGALVQTYNLVHLPVSQTKLVNGDTIDGRTIEYRFFGANGQPSSSNTDRPPLVHTVARPEITFSATVDRIHEGWATLLTVNRYDEKSKPTEVIKRGWLPIHYTYNAHGLPESVIQGDQQTKYLYYDNSLQVKSITSPDGLTKDFTYDTNQRLYTVSELGGKRSTTYTYHFGGQSSGNWINSVTTFQPPAAVEIQVLTNLDTLSTRKYYDGLGRLTQTAKLGYSFQGDNVYAVQAYDELNQITKSYGPYTSGATPDRANTEYGAVSPTVTTYLSDPTSRVRKTTLPEWPAGTVQKYYFNTEQLAVPGGPTYSARSLHILKTIDPDGKVTATYSDRRGQQILMEQYAEEASATPLARTYTLYDPKGRVVRVLPPDFNGSDNLIYQYEYDGADHVIRTKVPDAAPKTMDYDERGLVTFTVDPAIPAPHNYYVNVYDDYGRLRKVGLGSGEVPTATASDVSDTDLLQEYEYGSSGITIGKVVSERYRLVSSAGYGNFVESNYFYSPTYGWVDSIVGNNHLALTDLQSSKTNFAYDMAGNVLREHHFTAFGDQTLETVADVVVDHGGRTVEKWHQLTIDGDVGERVQTSAVEYTQKDEVAALLLGKSGNSWLQRVDYDYLANGYLSEVNDYANLENDIFAFRLFYHETGGPTGSVPLRNGNISGIKVATGTGQYFSTGFKYDGLNRLTNSRFVDLHTNTSGRYDTHYTYHDGRGNLASIERHGQYTDAADNVQYGKIDQLTFSYAVGNTTNQFTTIADAAGAGKDAGYVTNSSQPYEYDPATGNTTYDPSRDLTIDYNHLNLPHTFSRGEDLELSMLYAANGIKLQEVKIDPQTGDILERRDYLGAAEYTDERLTRVQHPDGFVRPAEMVSGDPCLPTLSLQTADITGSSGVYRALAITSTASLPTSGNYSFIGEDDVTLERGFTLPKGTRFFANLAPCPGQTVGDYYYQIKDHLGNVRITFRDIDHNGVVDANDVVQENHYYAFGLEMEGEWSEQQPTAEQRYRYNGKELSPETGLYAYGARYYDPTVGRFTGVDPISDQFPHVSTYNYAENEPIANIDLHGLQSYHYTGIQRLRQYAAGVEDRFNSLLNKITFSTTTRNRVSLFANGAGNTALGIGTTFGGAGVAGGSSGLAAPAGATIMMFGLTEAGIGISQMTDALAGNADPSSVLHESTTGPGLIAGASGSKYAALIDATAEVIPALMTGGLTTATGYDDVVAGLRALSDGKPLSGMNSLYQGKDAFNDLINLITEAAGVINHEQNEIQVYSDTELTDEEMNTLKSWITKQNE